MKTRRGRFALIAAGMLILAVMAELRLRRYMSPTAADLSPIIGVPMTDLSGNEMTPGSLIAQNRLTMLNFWGISCGPCLEEIPGLVKVREEFSEEGFGIVGIAVDLLDTSGEIDPELTEEAKALTAELGADYPTLMMTGETRKRMRIPGVPMTYLVDQSGEVVGKPVLGAYSRSEWERVVREALDALP